MMKCFWIAFASVFLFLTTATKTFCPDFNDDYCDCGLDESRTSACSGFADHIDFVCHNAQFVPINISSSLVADRICDCCDGSDEAQGTCNNVCSEVAVSFMTKLRSRIVLYRETLDSRQLLISLSKTQAIVLKDELLKAELRSLHSDEAKRLRALLYVPTLSGTWLTLTKSCLRKLEVQARFGDMGVTFDYYVFELCPFVSASQYALRQSAGEKLHQTEKALIGQGVDLNQAWSKYYAQLEYVVQINSADITSRFSLGKWWPIFSQSEQETILQNTPAIALRKVPPSSSFKHPLAWSILSKVSTTDYNTTTMTISQLYRQLNGWTHSAPLSDSAEILFLGSDRGIYTMNYGGGQQCYNGPYRSVLTKFFCGIDTLLVFVNENGKCAYEFEVSSPLACTASMLTQLKMAEQRIQRHLLDQDLSAETIVHTEL